MDLLYAITVVRVSTLTVAESNGEHSERTAEQLVRIWNETRDVTDVI